MYRNKGNFIVSDLSEVGFDKNDLGWEKLIFVGIAGVMSMLSVFAKYRKEEGGSGILIPVRFPLSNMKRFEEEVKIMIQGSTKDLLILREFKDQPKIYLTSRGLRFPTNFSFLYERCNGTVNILTKSIK